MNLVVSLQVVTIALLFIPKDGDAVSAIQGIPITQLEKCIHNCALRCPDTDVKYGCNQMFSCAQACKMRDLGINQENCNIMCMRNGQSGCTPKVKDHEFELCGSCIPERAEPGTTQCSEWPTVKDCQNGCGYYDGSTMPANVTCEWTLDNVANGVYYNGRPLPSDVFTGVRGDWTKKKTFWFVESTLTNHGELKFVGQNWGPEGQSHCVWSGLLLHCEASCVESGEPIVTSPWHNFTSNMLDWSSEDGRELCTNDGGMIVVGANTEVVQSLLAKGAVKIWAGEFENATLIGKPGPDLDSLYEDDDIYEDEEEDEDEGENGTTCSMIPSLDNIVGFVTCFLDTIIGFGK